MSYHCQSLSPRISGGQRSDLRMSERRCLQRLLGGSLLASLSLWGPQHSLASASLTELSVVSLSDFSLSLCLDALYFHTQMLSLGLKTLRADFQYPHHKEMRLWLCCLALSHFLHIRNTHRHIKWHPTNIHRKEVQTIGLRAHPKFRLVHLKIFK